MEAFLIPRVREYWDKVDVAPLLIQIRMVAVVEIAICARLARIPCANTNRIVDGVGPNTVGGGIFPA